MKPPTRIKDVQRLTGCLAVLSRFISRLAERALPFFKLMKGSGPFTWTEEAEQAFQEMKQHLTSLPILVAPEPGETLFLYLAATAEVISMVLVAERLEQRSQGDPVAPAVAKGGPPTLETVEGDLPTTAVPDGCPSTIEAAEGGLPTTEAANGPTSGGPAGSRPSKLPARGGPDPAMRSRTVQKPVYYVSEVLHEAKARYFETHKLLYAILIASRKLRHYFQTHKVVVVTSHLLRAILHNSNATGNIAKGLWSWLDFQPATPSRVRSRLTS